MKMTDIREIAKGLGIKTSRISKLNLVRNIQESEGNFGCFHTAHSGECDQESCIWRGDCLQQSMKKGSRLVH